MEREVVVNKALRDLKLFELITKDNAPFIRPIINAVYVAGWEAKDRVGGSEIPVEYTDRNGLKQIFPSIISASRSLDVHRSTIHEACKLNRRTKFGCFFRYVDHADAL